MTHNQTPRGIINNIRTPFFALEIFFIVHVAVLLYQRQSVELSTDSIISVSVEYIGLFVLLFAYYSLVRIKLNSRIYESFTLLLFFASLYLYTDIICSLIENFDYNKTISLVTNTFSFICTILVITMFFYFLFDWVGAKVKGDILIKRLVNIISIFAGIAVAGNLFLGYYFTISDEGSLIKGDYYYVSSIFILSILMLSIIYLLLSRIPVSEKLILIVFPILPVISFVVNAVTATVDLQYTVTFLAVFFIYTTLFVKREQLIQEQEIQLGEAEKQLTESEINALRAKINPHFIYNTLGSINSLCKLDPEAASDMTIKLETYLRDNFGKVSINPMIPFFEELEHLEHYLAIEQIRFPNIKVEIKADVDFFMVPSLSIQPMVENAIRHGIQKAPGASGTITITSEERPQGYYIYITDDGVGIDTDYKNDGKAHLGIENTKTRIELLCNGTLELHPIAPQGTCCIIFIPKPDED